MNEQTCLSSAPVFGAGFLDGHGLAALTAGPPGGAGQCIGEAAHDESFIPLVTLSLSPQGAPPKGRLCEATVDFLTAFWEERFAEEDRQPDGPCSIFGFVLSELMENAFKFNHGGDIRVAVGVGPWEWMCRVSNQVSAGAVSGLCSQLNELSRAEPGELLRRRAEANARHPEQGSSGLGVLLMREYGVRLGWTLQPLSHEQVRVETRARMPLLALQAWGARGGLGG